jgi:hypothetical protein
MWKLIVLFALVQLSYLNLDKKEEIILIIDDCQEWRVDLPSKWPEAFSIRKDLPKKEWVVLIHNWLKPEDKLSTLRLSFSEITNKKLIYSSELNYKDWTELRYGKDHEKIYILRPEDFCSQNRFLFDYKFTLHEVIIGTSESE